ncbi:MAG: Gfo/Idh/MocA family oxidoreductase [Chloroflexi bacterium]|nr:Gfo/Idh/MocA family oxidoreductase [Chloroflexota bacterium]
MKRVALIGCGGIGNYHLGHLLQFDDVKVAGACDLIAERAEGVAAKTGGQAFTDFRRMYDTVKPDMVFVCVPPTQHGEIELESVKRGIPMFIEKPIALDLELAQEIDEAITKAGLITAVGFQCRYSNIVEPTLQFTRDNQIVFVECARIGGVPAVEWWRVKSQSGGQLVEQTIHQLDMIRYAAGEPKSVYSMTTRGFVKGWENYDTDDLTVTAITFESGALGSVSSGCYAASGAAFDSKITFSTPDSRLDHYIIDRVNIYGAKPPEAKSGLVVQGDGTMASSSDGQVTIKDDGRAGITCDRTFVEAVISGDGSKIRSPYHDALKSLAFGLAANESMDTKKVVDVVQFA